MSTVTRLAEWALHTEVPGDVAARVRLHALSVAAAVPSAPIGPDAAAQRSSALLDIAPHGPVGAALVASLLYQDRTPGHRLKAVAIAEEVAAKIGTHALVGTVPADGRAWVTAVAVATVRGLLSDLPASQLADAIALSLSQPPTLTLTELGTDLRKATFEAAFRHGWTAVDRARRSEGGDLTVLDQQDGIPGVPVAVSVRTPLERLDRWWLRRLVLRADPVFSWLLTPVQGFAEILRRHMKAASKRLRIDQIERIDVRVDGRAYHAIEAFPAGDGPQRPGHLPSLLGALVAHHDGGPALEAAFSDGELLAKIHVRPDLGLTIAAMRGWLKANGALWAEIPLSARAGVLRGMFPHVALTRPDYEDARGIWNLGTGEVIERLVDPRPEDGDHLPRPTSLRLYTSRGGWWPERRAVAEGGPEVSWEDQKDHAVAGYVRARSWRAEGTDKDAGDDARAKAAEFLDRGVLEALFP